MTNLPPQPACRDGISEADLLREAERAVLYGAVLLARRPTTRLKPAIAPAAQALLPAVRSFLNGNDDADAAYALAYARSRHGGGNDYKRAARQQQVMLALLKKMSQPGMIFQLNNLIARVGSNVEVGSTDATKPFKPSMVADYIADAEAVPANNFTNLVLGPPYTASIPHNLSGGKASICLNIPMVATQSIKMFGTDSLYYGKDRPANTCP